MKILIKNLILFCIFDAIAAGFDPGPTQQTIDYNIPCTYPGGITLFCLSAEQVLVLLPFLSLTLMLLKETIPIPTFDLTSGKFKHTRSKHAIQFLPIIATLGFAAATAAGSAGLGYSLQLKQVTDTLISDVQELASSVTFVQDLLDSLAEVILQNRRGLDLLLSEQGSLCLALQERCCFYANKSGIIRDKLNQLQKRLLE
ncbi:syncytin-B-like [Tupaia chinensis]|uniref:syncytin-B-like n=1 Tax=Tupaia chinensis TaxID=246437 RepID=UPI0003C8EA78|nr:syncytin-B-like [Tupaia chinensis]